MEEHEARFLERLVTRARIMSGERFPGSTQEVGPRNEDDYFRPDDIRELFEELLICYLLCDFWENNEADSTANCDTINETDSSNAISFTNIARHPEESFALITFWVESWDFDLQGDFTDLFNFAVKQLGSGSSAVRTAAIRFLSVRDFYDGSWFVPVFHVEADRIMPGIRNSFAGSTPQEREAAVFGWESFVAHKSSRFQMADLRQVLEIWCNANEYAHTRTFVSQAIALAVSVYSASLPLVTAAGVISSDKDKLIMLQGSVWCETLRALSQVIHNKNVVPFACCDYYIASIVFDSCYAYLFTKKINSETNISDSLREWSKCLQTVLSQFYQSFFESRCSRSRDSRRLCNTYQVLQRIGADRLSQIGFRVPRKFSDGFE
jgi:hypothetical protein